MSLLRTHDGTVILIEDGHVISATSIEAALAELRRRKAAKGRAA